MKTIEEFYKNIIESEELQKSISEIKDKTVLADYLKNHDCEGSVEEFVKYVQSQCEGEIEDDIAVAVAGGFPYHLINANDVFSDIKWKY